MGGSGTDRINCIPHTNVQGGIEPQGEGGRGVRTHQHPLLALVAAWLALHIT